jgi:opine dehydrogenase
MNKTSFFETGLKLEDLGIGHMDKEQLLDYLNNGTYTE